MMPYWNYVKNSFVGKMLVVIVNVNATSAFSYHGQQNLTFTSFLFFCYHVQDGTKLSEYANVFSRKMPSSI